MNSLSSPLHPAAGTHSTGLSVVQKRTIRRFYLRLLLGAYLGLPGKDVKIIRRIKGRPELDSLQSKGELNFSVAVSDACYLIGISSGPPIGVDLECANRRAGRPLDLAERYFSTEETAALSTMSGDDLHHAFLHAWACKEAIVKAIGVGIANQLNRFTVDTDPANPPRVLSMLDDDPAAWQMAMAEPAKGAIAAVAVRQSGLQIESYRLS